MPRLLSKTCRNRQSSARATLHTKVDAEIAARFGAQNFRAPPMLAPLLIRSFSGRARFISACPCASNTTCRCAISPAFLTTFSVFESRTVPSITRCFARRTRSRPRSSKFETTFVTPPSLAVTKRYWRQNGKTRWAWLFRTPQASLFQIEDHRDAKTFDALFPSGFRGVLVTDCYAVYTRRQDILHAYCGAHVLCEAKKVLELAPASVSAQRFVYDFRLLMRRGEEFRAADDLDGLDDTRRRFHYLATNSRYQDHADIERLQARLARHEPAFTMFLSRPDIPWHNNATESDLRPLCSKRNVSRQTRSDAGATALGIWVSVTQTLRKNALRLGPWFADAMERRREGRAPPSVFAAAPT
jgi:hypothetical protein